MIKEAKLALMKERFNKLENRPQNTKCPGVKKKLARQLRNYTKGE